MGSSQTQICKCIVMRIGPTNWKSISGYVITMCGGAVSWSSKKQSVTALSSTEAEYIAAAHVAQEASWLQLFLMEIGCPPTKPLPFHIDNQSAIKLIKNTITHDCTKHIITMYRMHTTMVSSM